MYSYMNSLYLETLQSINIMFFVKVNLFRLPFFIQIGVLNQILTKGVLLSEKSTVELN